MKKNGYPDTTIQATGKRLRHLQSNCDLKDPEDVKGYIANKQCSKAYKETLSEMRAQQKKKSTCTCARTEPVLMKRRTNKEKPLAY